MSLEKIPSEGFEIKAYTKKDLRQLYGIHEASFRRWLKQIPETAETGKKNWLTAKQVEAVIKNYGVPGEKKFKKVVY